MHIPFAKRRIGFHLSQQNIVDITTMLVKCALNIPLETNDFSMEFRKDSVLGKKKSRLRRCLVDNPHWNVSFWGRPENF